jgi:primosomal protein N'
MAVFGFTSASERDCESFAQRFDTALLSLHSKEYNDLKIIKYGPFKHGIYKVMGKYRQRIILKYKDSARAREFFSKLLVEGLSTAPRSVKVDLDVNPTIV